MELLLISDKKLKIMMTKHDMESYNLTSEALDYGVENSRHSLDEIFELAERKTGFKIKKEKLFVQAYPSLDGGCEIYLTRLEGEISGLVEDGSVNTYVLGIYKTEKDALGCARIIKSTRGIEDISVYEDIYNGTYLVIIKLNKKINDSNRTYIRACLTEMGCEGSATVRRKSFSKERYRLIMSL